MARGVMARAWARQVLRSRSPRTPCSVPIQHPASRMSFVSPRKPCYRSSAWNLWHTSRDHQVAMTWQRSADRLRRPGALRGRSSGPRLPRRPSSMVIGRPSGIPNSPLPALTSHLMPIYTNTSPSLSSPPSYHAVTTTRASLTTSMTIISSPLRHIHIFARRMQQCAIPRAHLVVVTNSSLFLTVCVCAPSVILCLHVMPRMLASNRYPPFLLPSRPSLWFGPLLFCPAPPHIFLPIKLCLPQCTISASS